MLYVTKKVREVLRGPTVYRTIYDDRATTEEAEMMAAVVADWLAGKIEPTKIKKIGYNAVGRKVFRKTIRGRAKDGKTVTYRYEERPLEAADLVQASLWTVGPTGLAYDPETHEEIKPTVAVIGPDGSAAYLPVPDKFLPDLPQYEPQQIIEDAETGSVQVVTPPPAKRRRGRPRKVKE